MTDHERAKKLRDREIAALQLCACRYPLIEYRYRNGHGHEPECPAIALALGIGAFDNQ